MTEDEMSAIRRTPEYAEGYNDHRKYLENRKSWAGIDSRPDGSTRAGYSIKWNSVQIKNWTKGAYSALDMCRDDWPALLPPLDEEIPTLQLSLFD